MAKPTVVEVVWIDAQDHPDTWVDAGDAGDFNDSACEITSIGYLIKRTDKYVTIGGDYDLTDDNYGTVRKIPVGVIKSLDILPPL